MLSIRPISRRTVSYIARVVTCSVSFLRGYHKDIVRENEIVLLRSKTNSNAKPVLTPRLRPGKRLSLDTDSVLHDDIIGQPVGFGLTTSRRKAQYRIFRPTLGEYTDNCPRVVTPIYSQDASLIVTLLDLHPGLAGYGSDKLEIFEAGTGNGALTLHLARAIHKNEPALSPGPLGTKLQKVLDSFAESSSGSSRNAIIHTLDTSANFSAHAQTILEKFRNGVYRPNVEFHVGTIDAYLRSRLADTGGLPVLNHAILDLPDTHDNLKIVSDALKPNGKLVAFCPSITQINTCVLHIKDHKIPMYLDQVLELGSAGGREWDVRPVQPGKRKSAQKEEKPDVEIDSHSNVSENRWAMVCRPKVGVKTVGGGFIGIWRKMLFDDV